MQHQGLSIFYPSAFTDGLFLCLRKIPQFKSCNDKHVRFFFYAWIKKNNKEITSTLLGIQRFLLRIGFIFLRND